MLDLITTFAIALYDLSNDMAIYILIGLLFAGILHELVPTSLIEKHLGRSSIGSVIKATLFGIPLPVCSCGVIPLAAAIKKSGASNGATLSFLISTPITGVDSVLATFGMFGWAFTLYRLITSMIIATVAGILNNIFERTPPSTSFTDVKPTTLPNPLLTPQEAPYCNNSCTSDSSSKTFSFSAAMRYGFITLLGDIAKPLFWGLLIGAMITTAIPENLSEILTQSPWLSYLIVVAIAVPMYVCATASLPIAASLIMAGIAPGAAFVFLSAGPATNTVTIGVVKKMLGIRSLLIYLTTITLGSILFGLGMDLLFTAADINIQEMLHKHETAGIFAIGSSVVMWGLLLYFLFRSSFPKKKSADSSPNANLR